MHMRVYKQHIDAANKSLAEYAETRRSYCGKGLEAPELSALLVEKYSCGIRDGLRSIDPKCDIDPIIEMTDKLCRFIDPDYEDNRMLRYTKAAKLDLNDER